ncbi:hypothetical protein V8E55_010217 [Tylopilus felleus]
MDHSQTPQSPQPQATEDITPQHIEVASPSSGGNSGAVRDTRSQTSSVPILHATSEGHHTRSHDNPYTDFERIPSPRPTRSRDGHVRVSARRQMSNADLPAPQNTSGIDWIVPVENKNGARRTVGERLQPTIDHATVERDKYAKKALFTGYALNIAIGLQVFLGALTTGLAAAVTSGRQAQVSTATLGGLATLVASYMARARGSGEPELSITRVKDLEQFLRECKAFQMDHAHEYGTPENRLSERLEDLRQRFEELLGNANGERKLSPVGITATQA